MARILFKSIIYSSCERALKNGRVQSKIGNRLLVTWFFWLHMIIYDYFSTVFCIAPKKVLSLKYRKWVSHLKNRYYPKVVENARIHFSVSPYCILLFSGKENYKIFCSSLVSCSLQWRSWLHYECERISALTYCQYHTGHLLAFRKRP